MESTMNNLQVIFSSASEETADFFNKERMETGAEDVTESSGIGAGFIRGVLIGMRRGMASALRVTFAIMFGAPLKWFRPSRVRWQEVVAARAGISEQKLMERITWKKLFARDGVIPVAKTIGLSLGANSLLGCIMFGVFETADEIMVEHPAISPIRAHYCAGGLAGLCMAVPSTTFDNVRIWALQNQNKVREQPGRSLFRIAWNQQYGHLRRGFLLTCMRDVLSVSAFFGLSYSFFEGKSQARKDEERRIPMWKAFLAGGAGAIVSDLVAQPFTRLKEERAGILTPQKGLPILRLYHGTNPATVIAGAIPGGCALLMYEYSKRLDEES